MANGGIQPGTTATSIESHTSELLHNQWVKDVIDKMGSDWKIQKSIKILDINSNAEYSFGQNEKSLTWASDGGFIVYKGVIVGVCENKYQRNVQNACERVFRYLSFMKGSQIFVSCSGEGFKKINGGGSTGPTIDMLRFCGAYVLENVIEEDAFKIHLRKWLRKISDV
jgi:hypothetical protein